MTLTQLRQIYQDYMMAATLAVMVLGLVFVFFSPSMLVTIPAGHIGVRWYRFHGGTDTQTVLPEGVHFKWPWDQIYDYDARLQVMDQQYDVITKDGLLVHTTISFRFRIHRESVGTLHKNIGPDYINVLLVTEIGATARNAISQYTAEDFYTTYRAQVRNHILAEMKERLYKQDTHGQDGVDAVELEQVMLKSIQLPERVVTAIESKIAQYQRQLEYDFRLQIEAKEKERRRLEGEGVRLLFDNVGEKNLPSFLRLAGINATLELAKSNNTKIIVSGSSLSALPLLVGDEKVVPPDLSQKPPEILKPMNSTTPPDTAPDAKTNPAQKPQDKTATPQ